MAEPIVLDTNVLADISRGHKDAADALRNYINTGRRVYISRAAYEELVTRAPNPFLGGHYREMLNDLHIDIAPSGAMKPRVNVYTANIQHDPAPGQPGQLQEYDRKDDPTKPGDVFVAAQTKAINGQVWTHDEKFIKRAPQFGIKLAPECNLGGRSGTEDPVRGRELLGLNPKQIGPNGEVIRPAGGGGGGGTKASIGVADNSLPEPGAPSARGTAIIGGMQLAFEGVNFVLNLINDYIQRQKVNDALDKIRPQVDSARAANPQRGILLLFYYRQFEAPEDSIIKPGAVFDYVMWGQGVTRDEALQDAFRLPTISRGPGPNERKFSQEVWIPPLKPSSLTIAKCPFQVLALGRFFLGNSKKARFQLVEFNYVGGFDDICEKSLDLPDDTNVDFAVLKAPTEVEWFNINGRHTVDVPVKVAKTVNGNEIKVVDLDPWTPFNAKAVMVFPVDDWGEQVFKCVPATDHYWLLTNYANFNMIRWVRAENIHLIRFV